MQRRFQSITRLATLLLGLAFLTLRSWHAPAQRTARSSFLALSEDFYRSGEALLLSFSPTVSTARLSVVQFLLDGKAVALGAVVDPNGLAITKASELKAGKLTAKLPDGRIVEATGTVADLRNDVALVKLNAAGLRPVAWSEGQVALGQWMVTPGLDTKPEAVGVLSAATRKLHKRALIGVRFAESASNARIDVVMPNYGAAAAGLRPGDVVLAVNGTAVKDGEELRNALGDFREGQIVDLRVQRDEQEFEVSVEMKPDNLSPTFQPARGSGRQGRNRGNFSGGELSQRAEDFELVMQHDTVLQPWQCGGPLVDLTGKAVGLNIARAGRIATYALPVSLVKRIIAELKARPLEPVNPEPGNGG